VKAKPPGGRYRRLCPLAVLVLALGCAKNPTEADSGGVERYGLDKFMVSESDFLGRPLVERAHE